MSLEMIKALSARVRYSYQKPSLALYLMLPGALS